MSSAVTGASPGSLSARCVALSVFHLCENDFSPLSLIIDPLGRSVPAGPGAVQRTGTGTGLDTLRNEVVPALVILLHRAKALRLRLWWFL